MSFTAALATIAGHPDALSMALPVCATQLDLAWRTALPGLDAQPSSQLAGLLMA